MGFQRVHIFQVPPFSFLIIRESKSKRLATPPIYQGMPFAKPMCALREARPTAGDGPRRRRGAPFLTGRAKYDALKNDAHPVKNSAISAGRWRCRKECPFLLLLFFWASKRKVKIPRATTKAKEVYLICASAGVQARFGAETLPS